jgi:hypothetical protein
MRGHNKMASYPTAAPNTAALRAGGIRVSATLCDERQDGNLSAWGSEALETRA